MATSRMGFKKLATSLAEDVQGEQESKVKHLSV
jgi:hypothetical protein